MKTCNSAREDSNLGGCGSGQNETGSPDSAHLFVFFCDCRICQDSQLTFSFMSLFEHKTLEDFFFFLIFLLFLGRFQDSVHSFLTLTCISVLCSYFLVLKVTKYFYFLYLKVASFWQFFCFFSRMTSVGSFWQSSVRLSGYWWVMSVYQFFVCWSVRDGLTPRVSAGQTVTGVEETAMKKSL